MNEGLVTVVISIYKVEKYLNRCIESVIKQTYKNLEIILVDDGSPDKCPEICDDWCSKDLRITVIHKKNAGLGMARNTGIENAHGEYICFFDSDDFVEYTLIEKAYIAAKKNNAQSVIYGYNCIASNGSIREINIPSGTMSVFSGDDIRNLLLLDMIDPVPNEDRISKVSMSAWSKLYYMDLINKTGWRFCSERDFSCEDLYSHLNWYANVETTVVLHEALYNYCDNGTSLTKTYRFTAPHESEVCYDAMMDICKKRQYGYSLEYRLGFWYYGSIIGICKSVMNSEMTKREKIAEYQKILNSEHFNTVMRATNFSKEKKSRRIMHSVICKKWYRLFYIMLYIQNIIS